MLLAPARPECCMASLLFPKVNAEEINRRMEKWPQAMSKTHCLLGRELEDHLHLWFAPLWLNQREMHFFPLPLLLHP